MSTPLATIFHGDVTLEQGSDITQFGWGDLTVQRSCIIKGTEDSTSDLDGALTVAGGVGITKNLNVHKDLNVLYGITRLTQTHIDTNNGRFSVTGGNTVHIQVGASSDFVSTGGDINISSLQKSVQLYGGLNSSTAVDIQAINVAGGVKILSGSESGKIDLIAASGGISGFSTNGNVTFTANNGSGSFYVNSSTGNQNLILNLNGQTDSQLKIESEGINTTNTAPALYINTTNTRGNIQISNANGRGDGSITQLTGSGGFRLITNTSGPISLTSQGAGSNYYVNSNGNNQNLVVSLNNSYDSAVIIKSDGTNVSRDAIQIYTTDLAGNITLSQPSLSMGKISLLSGNSGIIGTTQDGGSIELTTNSATSLYTNVTTADHQDLTISVTGDTDSKVNITSFGKSSNAIQLSATNTNSGIFLTANGKIELESADTTYGINIATSSTYPNIPVHIGTPGSTTTIYGDLNVKGITTTVESTVVTISDNIIIVNNTPEDIGRDGGLAIKRFQSANNSGIGDVVNDVPEETGTVQSTGNSETTVHLANEASNIENYYAGWWIKIFDGLGAGQIRRIKSYNNITKIATIYDDTDHTILNTQPIEGLNFETILDNTSKYNLYPCHFVMMIWDESEDEFSLVCSNINPSDHTSIAHYSDLHINDLNANAITANTINGSIADFTFTITLNNNSTSPVSMSDFPNIYGIYLVFVKPLNNSDSNRCHAIFMVGRVDAIGITGTVVRLMSVKGVYGDQLDIQWPVNDYPQILYRPYPNGIGGTTDFKVKISSL